MHLQLSKFSFTTLSFVHLVQSLPGRHASATLRCVDDIDGIRGTPCHASPATSDLQNAVVTTPGPVLAGRFVADLDKLTATCEDGTCSIFDVSSTLITVVVDSLIQTSTCVGKGCTSHKPSLTTRHVSASPTTIPKGPFLNRTTTSDTLRGPTGTGRYTESNSTTFVHKTTTVSATTFTDPAWSVWTNTPITTSRGNSGVSTSCTSDEVWSNRTSINGTGGFVSPTRSTTSYITWTSVFEGHTATTVVAVPPRSYISTASYTFSGTTIEIPFPASFTGRLPIAKGPADTSSLGYAANHTPGPKTHGKPSDTLVSAFTQSTYTSCFTTTNKASTGTGSATAAVAKSTLVCWGLHCNADHFCTDFLSRYPFTASSSSPYPNSTAIGQAYPAEPDEALPTNTLTDWPLQPSDTVNLWPDDPANATQNAAAYTHTGPVPLPLGPGTSPTPTSALNPSSSFNPVVVNAVSVTTLYSSSTDPSGRPIFSAYSTITFSSSSEGLFPTASANQSNHWGVWPSNFFASPADANDRANPTPTASAHSTGPDADTVSNVDPSHNRNSNWMGGMSQSQRKRAGMAAHRVRNLRPITDGPNTHEASDTAGESNVWLGKKQNEG